METSSQSQVEVSINIIDTRIFLIDSPIQIQIFRSDLSLELSFWIKTHEFNLYLLTGIYLISIISNSNIYYEEVIDLSECNAISLNYQIDSYKIGNEDIVNPDSYEINDDNKFNKSNYFILFIDWIKRIFSKKSRIIYKENKIASGFKGSTRTMTMPKYGEWEYYFGRARGYYNSKDKKSFKEIKFIKGTEDKRDFIKEKEIRILVVESKYSAPMHVFLPPLNDIRVRLKLRERVSTISSIFEISVNTRNGFSELLLSLMMSGDIGRAKTLISNDTGNKIEKILQEKLSDPISAVIGGYFLLKINELERMHGWTYNLARSFDWIPDALIIHAWYIIKSREVKPNDVSKIKEVFLKAVKIGLPIFTEGLRLLYDGLLMLNNYIKNNRGSGEDPNVVSALMKIEEIKACADMSQNTTTIIGFYN